jgi:hypothetical protein
MGTDSKTNHEIMPFDRLVVPRDESRPRSAVNVRRAPQPALAKPGADKDLTESYFDRRTNTDAPGSLPMTSALERRLDEMERKLDTILRKLGERDDK